MLKPYMVHGGYPEGGACLVFARSVQEARITGWKEVSWIRDAAGGEFINVRAKLLREDKNYWLSLADQEKLKSAIPHAVESPPTCRICGYWNVLDKNGLCKECAKAILKGGDQQ